MRKLDANPAVKEIRGQGLMIGIELDRPCREIVMLALEQKLLISVQADNTIRLLPPLTIDDEQADLMISITCMVINQFTGAKL